MQNYLKPLNPETAIKYPLVKPGDTTLLIYILLGQEEKSRELEGQPTGYHTIRWDASNSTSQIYFYSLQAGDFIQTRKMVLLK